MLTGSRRGRLAGEELGSAWRPGAGGSVRPAPQQGLPEEEEARSALATRRRIKEETTGRTEGRLRTATEEENGGADLRGRRSGLRPLRSGWGRVRQLSRALLCQSGLPALGGLDLGGLFFCGLYLG